MARTPKPPKLKQSGFNRFQKLIVSLFCFAVILLLVFPYGVGVLFGSKDITNTLDGEVIKAWIIVAAIAIAAFLAVTPEFWRYVGNNLSKLSLPEPSDRRWRPVPDLHTYPAANEFTEDERLWLNSDVFNTMGVRTLWNAFQAIFVFLPVYLIGQLFSIPESAMGIFFLFIWLALIGFLTVADLRKFTDLRERFYGMIEDGDSFDATHAERSENKAGFSFTDNKVNDDDFAFDPSAFNDQQHAEKTKQRKAVNRSKKMKTETGRHPDDANLWEVVSDPASTAEERKTALEMILEREAGRSNE